MKTGRTPGILALVMAALLCVAFTGCTGTTAPAATSTVAPPATETPAVTTATPEQTVVASTDTSPITYTFGMNSANCTIGDGTHQDYAVMAELTKLTGITLNFVTYDSDKFKVLLAGGDLPDFFNLDSGSVTSINTMISSNMILPLDDLLDQYGQNIEQNIPLALKWAKNTIGGGKTYFLPIVAQKVDTSNYLAGGLYNFLSRYDIYKAIGSPVITDSEDGFLSVLKQMQDYQRNKTGDQTIYALSAWTDWGMWPFIITYPFAHGFTNGNYNQEFNCETGEMESIFLKEDSSFWKGIKFFNKAYQMGIFNPEGLTTKFADLQQEVANGKVLSVEAAFFWTDAKACGDDSMLEILPGSADYIANLYSIDSPLGYGIGGSRMINANCPKPERVMQLWNFADSVDGARMLFNGIKGVEWDVVDGKAQLSGDFLSAVIAGKTTDYGNARKLGVAAGDMTANLGSYLSSGSEIISTTDGAPIDLTSSLDIKIAKASATQKKYAQDFNMDFVLPGQVFNMWVQEGKAKAVTNPPLAAQLMATPSDATMRVESEATAYFMANVGKVVLAKDDAAYDKAKADMIQAFKDMGLDVCDAELQRLYSDAQATVNSITGK